MTSRAAASLAVLAAVLAIGAALYLNIFRGKPAALEPYPVPFQEVSKDVYRQGYLWSVPIAGGRLIDVHVFLFKVGQDYILVDVGAPGEDYERILSTGLREAVKDGKLRLVALSHGHVDHVGALASLVKEYPDMQVMFHEEEAPFLTGKASYGDIPSDHPLKYGVFDVSSALPATRVLLLRGESGDISEARGPAGQKAKWVPPIGTISFHHAPGHAPGHVSYLHKPSGSLIAGDVFGNLAGISLPPPMFTPNMTEARLSLRKISSLDFVKAFCAHDRLEGVTQEALQQGAKTF